MFRHLYDSYNKFLDEDVKTYLEYGENIFSESIKDNMYYRYKFKYSNIRVQEPTMDNGVEPKFPSDARHGNSTYSVTLIADVEQHQEVVDIIRDEKTSSIVGVPQTNVPIAIIPLMLRSKWCSLTTHKEIDKNECAYDAGGYFIVNGNEKVVISQDRMVENKPLIFQKKDSGITTLMAQVNSRSYKSNGLIQFVQIKIKKDGNMTIKVPILHEVNVFILLRALGLTSDRDIINYTVYDITDIEMVNLVRVTLDSCVNEKKIKINSEEEAIDFLINKLRVVRKYTETDKETKLHQKKIQLRNLLNTLLLPHVEGNLLNKAYYISYMINKLLKAQLKRITIDDRDSYVNKRIDLPGDLMFDLFKQQYKKMLGECKKQFDSRNKDNHTKPLNMIVYIKPNVIGQGFKGALSTGYWIRRAGVAQMLNRLSYLQTISMLRRVDAPGGDGSSSTLTCPRHLHPSSIGFLCPSETPEHAKVGLIKHLSLISTISIMSRDQTAIVKDYMIKNVTNVCDVLPHNLSNNTHYKVFLNGDWIGMSNNYLELEENFTNMKLRGYFDQKNVSLVVDHEESEIKVFCDSGRLIRPTIKVTQNQIHLKPSHIDSISLNKIDKLTKVTDWDEFLLKHHGVIEYIDMETQPFVMISDKIRKIELMRKKFVDSISNVKNIKHSHQDNRYDDMFYINYSHCEIHPSLLLGEITSNVPFVDHNQGPRVIFGYAQAKQAMGIYTTNYRDRLDISYILYHPHKPIVTTRTSRYTNSNMLTSGENTIVGISVYTGYNQEDSLVFNNTSIQRGKFRSMYLKKISVQIQKNQSTSQDDIFTKPDPMKILNPKISINKAGTPYDKLNDKGYVPEETAVSNGDVLIGKITPIQDAGNSGKQYKDSSEVYKHTIAPAIVDRVYDGIQNQDGYDIKKMLLRSERIPRIGDKFCSLHGQKGTIGINLDGIDMPFTKDGVQPDIILNPNALPGRMTIGQLVECIVGKAAAIDASDADGTAFEEHDMEAVESKLESHGFEKNGCEYLYNGMTGEKIKTMIFIGPTYYQRLKHLVEDKIHSRATGTKTLLTRQAPEGRTRDGGLRLGEMEQWALCAHGISLFTKEKLLDNSDSYSVNVCNKCGLFTQRTKRKTNKSIPQPDDVSWCPVCNNYNDISKIVIPYAFKLLVHELMSMCIVPRIRIKKD